MPFKTNDNHTFPPLSQLDIEIRFEGLLLLVPTARADQGTNCAVGVLRAPNHSLKVTVSDKGNIGQELQPPMGGPITFPLRIYAGNLGVTKFVSAVQNPFPGTDQNDPRDFRWAVDLKSLHQNSTPATSPALIDYAVRLFDGVLFSSKLTDPSRLAVHLKSPNGTRKCWNKIAAELGAFIQLGAMQSLTLEWDNAAGVQRWQLMKGSGSGEGYLVRIENLPPLDDDSLHDDFEAYYTYGIDTVDLHHELMFYKRLTLETAAGVDAPCMSGTSDGDGRT